MTQPRRPRSVLAAALGVGLVLLVSGCDVLPPAPPGGETASCDDIAWGSGAKTAARMSVAPIIGARAGRHHCYDRLVIDLGATPAPGWYVAYGTVSAPGSGQVVPVRGTDMAIVARAPAHDADYDPTYSPANPSEAVDVADFSTFRQVAFLDSFEGQTTFALGVRARLPFRVFATEHTGRGQLVVDVAHRWP
jgi:hypothetical protein